MSKNVTIISGKGLLNIALSIGPDAMKGMKVRMPVSKRTIEAYKCQEGTWHDLLQQRPWRTNMLQGMLCLGDDLITLTAVSQPPDDGTVENYREVIYRLTHTDLQTGATKHLETDNENNAVLLLAAWAASDEHPAGHWFEKAMDDLRSSDLRDSLP